MAVEPLKTRKRKHIDYNETSPANCDLKDDAEESVGADSFQSLAQAEAEDLEDLVDIAAKATVIEFDRHTGRPIRCSHQSPSTNEISPIDGLVKISSNLLSGDLFRDLSLIHTIVKNKVSLNDMVPWAGVDGDSTRLRAFGFLGRDALSRLDRDSAIRLHAPEKQGVEALRDEQANRRAICVLSKTRERVWMGARDGAKGNESKWIQTTPKTVSPASVAQKLCAAILTGGGGGNRYLNSDVLCSKELIAYQTNLHNGAKHLAAHLDAPLHEGFGKVIVTVAIRGSATILLIGKGDDDDDDGSRQEFTKDRDDKCDQGIQPAWKFHLKDGEGYVLSGNARNICLHAVLATDDCGGGDRESLNLRFGIHSVEEAERDIKRHWPDLW